ncbi:MAG TPA: 2-phospho-L-lactate transferase CofD family protein [Burkholderiales bacterium]|nr:2-phospho-L-lactate transferase CofD family protein [Burkholderiales bacterium]
MGSVVALAGQIGGAKLADGLYRLRAQDLTVIVNTGDDFEHLGLALSPDLDSVLYALAGIASPTAGWEPQGESRVAYGMLKALGGPDRPIVGDKSLAVALLRTEWLRSERSLTHVTLELCKRMGVVARVLPMSDDPVCTQVLTEDGAVSFHEYFTELACEPIVRGFYYAGAADARLSDEVLDALHAHDLEAVVITPANPYHAIRPILEVHGMRELLRKRGAPIVAVSPIVGGKALKGSAGKMMRELGREPSALAVAGEYLGLVDGFVIDREDARLADSIRSLGMQVLVTQTVMRTDESRLSLARAVLDFAEAIRETKAAALQS